MGNGSDTTIQDNSVSGALRNHVALYFDAYFKKFYTTHVTSYENKPSGFLKNHKFVQKK